MNQRPILIDHTTGWRDGGRKQEQDTYLMQSPQNPRTLRPSLAQNSAGDRLSQQQQQLFLRDLSSLRLTELMITQGSLQKFAIGV